MVDILTLCYHALSPTWTADLSVRPEPFEHQLESALARGYVPTTLSGLRRGAARRRVLIVTFDDAFESVREVAAPIMARLGIPGTVFVPTDYPGTGRPIAWEGVSQWLGGPHEHELGCMGWDELRALAESGWEIGSHTCSHPHLTQLDDESLAHEMESSRQVCEEQMGTPCPTLAYPYGDWDDRVVAAARTAGYEQAVTLSGRSHVGSPLRIPRVGVYNGDDERRYAIKTSRALRQAKQTPVWNWLEGRRGALRSALAGART